MMPAFTSRKIQSVFSILAILFVLSSLFFTSVGRAQQQDFLDPEKAFVLRAQMAEPGLIKLQFKIANGYYMYREQFAFKLDIDAVQLGEGRFPVGQIKHDPTFDKKMELYFKEAIITLPITAWPKDLQANPFVLTVTGQGCADAGICYPPMDFAVTLQATTKAIGYLVESPSNTLGLFDRIQQ